MVECSPALQKLQYSNLKCMDDDVASEVEKPTISTLAGTPIKWHSALEQVPTGGKRYLEHVYIYCYQRQMNFVEKKVEVQFV